MTESEYVEISKEIAGKQRDGTFSNWNFIPCLDKGEWSLIFTDGEAQFKTAIHTKARSFLSLCNSLAGDFKLPGVSSNGKKKGGESGGT